MNKPFLSSRAQFVLHREVDCRGVIPCRAGGVTEDMQDGENRSPESVDSGVIRSELPDKERV
jgi:hypothetical protein